jgi:hypothetical protein
VGGARGDQRGYAYLSTRPLHILVFLLPLVVLYEAGAAFYFSDAGSFEKIRAKRLMSQLFEWFGAGGLYLPGLLLVVVLLIWHALTRDRWRVRWSVPAWMAVESVIWTPPLLVMMQMAFRAFHGEGSSGGASGRALGVVSGGAGPLPALAEMSAGAKATVSIGAGLYEEMLFRLVAIALVHAVAADALRIKDGPAKAVAVFVSAVAFGLYHDVWLPGGGIDPGRMAIYTLAGLYFGAVFVLRGFGIVVAVHVLYDLAVLVLLAR